MTIQSLPLLHVIEPIPASDSALAALNLMLDLAINHLPVVDAHGHYLGMLTLTDLLHEILPAGLRLGHGIGQPDVSFLGDAASLLSTHLGQLSARTAGDVADPHVVPLETDCPLVEAARRLAEARNPLPVVDADRHIVGVLSVRLLLTHLLGRGVQSDAR